MSSASMARAQPSPDTSQPAQEAEASPEAPRAEPAPRPRPRASRAPERLPESRWWESHTPPPRSSARVPLAATGGALAGLGFATVVASGIVWIVAWGRSRQLDDECAGNLCVEGTDGGDTYKAVRELSRASAITVGIGFPVMTTGIVLLAFGIASGDRVGSVRAAPIVTAKEQGLVLEAKF